MTFPVPSALNTAFFNTFDPHASSTASTPVASSTGSVCPGFNFAIGTPKASDFGPETWNVYNDGCTLVDGFAANLGPPNVPGMQCTPPTPRLVTVYNSTKSGLYQCRTDPRSGLCGKDVITVCCRDDGK
ncbi:hypothetical protein DFH07DRAFT_974452 [Mycena maculata]|uniref:Uncharacterized protein n=1 Tax=Mycena maculata TaxID=230809 RepID=A0AAD7H7U6_9AGAR|nr:hypothetical protein DFH07DRAFT_974452 [Mycena maculata]